MPSHAGRRKKRDDRGRQHVGGTPVPAAPSPPAAGPEAEVPVPRDFGRDGISGLVSPDRALRAREVSRPRPEDEADAVEGAEAMLRRLGNRLGGQA